MQQYIPAQERGQIEFAGWERRKRRSAEDEAIILMQSQLC